MPSQTYNTHGTHVFNVPAGVTSLKVEIWGAGGNGAAGTSAPAGGGGGGGGFYSVVPAYTVIAGNNYNAVVGIGGGSQGVSSSSPGTADSYFDVSSVAYAQGGGSASGTADGAAGTNAGSGDVGGKHGGNGGSSSSTGGSGGGGAGAQGSVGSVGTSESGTTGGAGGAGGTIGTGSSAGGSGGNGGVVLSGNGVAGNSPGGGGGGGAASAGTGGAGSDGQITLTWTTPPPGYGGPAPNISAAEPPQRIEAQPSFILYQQPQSISPPGTVPLVANSALPPMFAEAAPTFISLFKNTPRLPILSPSTLQVSFAEPPSHSARVAETGFLFDQRSRVVTFYKPDGKITQWQAETLNAWGFSAADPGFLPRTRTPQLPPNPQTIRILAESVPPPFPYFGAADPGFLNRSTKPPILPRPWVVQTEAMPPRFPEAQPTFLEAGFAQAFSYYIRPVTNEAIQPRPDAPPTFLTKGFTLLTSNPKGPIVSAAEIPRLDVAIPSTIFAGNSRPQFGKMPPIVAGAEVVPFLFEALASFLWANRSPGQAPSGPKWNDTIPPPSMLAYASLVLNGFASGIAPSVTEQYNLVAGQVMNEPETGQIEGQP
jgi:hypothetical protein